jgi:hemoglobin/transferrin/lactoferrin receptor protein
MKKAIACFFLWMICNQIQAQETEDTGTIYNTIKEVVLTANKKKESAEDIPQQVQIIKRRNIQQLMPQTSADALIQNGNVFVQKSQMGGGSPNIRGFEANSVLLVVDGVRMNNAIYRGGHLQNIITIDPNALERMEVMVGPGSVMYGSDALGGVLHMYTLQPKLSTNDSYSFTGSAFGRYSSANKENTFHAHLNFGKANWAAVSSVSFANFGDLRMGGNNSIYKNDTAFGNKAFYVQRLNGRDSIYRNDNPLIQRFSGYNQVDLLQKLLFVPNQTTQHLVNFQFSESSNIPRYDRLTQVGDNDTPRFSEWYYGPQKRLLASYTLTKSDKKWYDLLTLNANYQRIEESRNQRRFGDVNLRNRAEKLNIGGINLDLLKEFNEKHELRYGAEAIYNLVSSEGTQINLNTDQEISIDSRYPDGSSTINIAAYGSYRWEIDSHWVLSAGARLNHYQLAASFSPSYGIAINNNEIEQTTTVATGNLGLVFKPTEKWRFIGNIGTGFRNPNIDDVAKTFERDGGTIVLPINEVKPERVFQQELGLDWFFRKFAWFELRVYNTNFQDAIATLPTNYLGNDSINVDGRRLQVLSNSNIPNAQIQGVSASLRYKWSKFFSMKASFELTKGTDLTNDVPLSHIAPAFGSVYFNYNKPKYNVLFYTIFNLAKPIEQYSPSPTDNAVFAPLEGTPAWYTLNLKGRYSVSDKVRIQGGIENILDLNYRYFASGLSAAGRNIVLSVNYRF